MRTGPGAAMRGRSGDGALNAKEGAMKGKAIVITGGFGALGQVVAEAAARRGASVAALDVAAAPPAGLVERLAPDALLLGGVDLTSPEGARRAMAEVKARFGRLDALVNIAGGFR